MRYSYIHSVLAPLSKCCPHLEGRLLTRYSPVRHLVFTEINTPFDLHVLSTPPAFVLSQDQTLYKMVSKRFSPFKSNHRVIYHDFIYFSFIVAAFGRIDYSLFTHNFVASLVKSSLRWCFLFSRCLIYKVHVPQAEHSLLYQAQFFLSSTFFKSFSDFFFPIFSDLQALDSFTSSPSNSLVRIPDMARNVKHFFRFISSFFKSLSRGPRSPPA